MAEHHNITFEVEGLESEGGHVRLDVLLKELRLLQDALKEAEDVIDDQDDATVFYKVIDASHNSPFKIILEPFVKTKKKQESACRSNKQTGGQIFFRDRKLVS
ncbi:MAG: hypothetical protein HC904_15405 [Blastochloris sp.]|nr:hypothetical protein [Blastochloris sp.]